jgi:predicted metal-dependent phosphotriesterase family hydrolase
MAFLHTVTGNIVPHESGITYSHEHLLFRPPEPFRSQDPDMVLDDIKKAEQEARYFVTAGGKCLVEMSTIDLHRDAAGLKAISEATGVHIISATGFNKAKFSEAFVAEKPVEWLAEEMVSELNEGIDGTEIRAGLIKASSSKDAMTPGETKVFKAAILAHKRTGAPISTHTEAGTLALEQIRILVDGGVPANRVLIGHLDRKLEWDYLLAVARSGVMMGFDQIGKEKYYPDARRIEMIKRLVAEGYTSQIFLSMDLARKSYWPSYGFGYGPGLTYILWRFVPWLLEEGISRASIEAMLIHNPASFFSW